jgi:glycosyltransferase involved in cell wall biosynthesis
MISDWEAKLISSTHAVMNIAQITSVYLSVPPKTHGGTERIVYHLCQHLHRRGHDVELFASGDSQVDCKTQSVLPVASLNDPNSTFYLEKEFETRNTYNLYRQAHRFDVIHAHWPTLAPYFSDSANVPTVITYAYMEKALHEYYRGHFPRCFPVCVSKAQARLLGDGSLPVVYNGIDLNDVLFNDRPEDFFIVVGRMTQGKGIAEAIRIARKAKVKLVIVGDVSKHLPWSETYYVEQVKPFVDGAQIQHIPQLAYERLLELMGRARGFLFPLQWDEPFGMVVIEAMAAGTPVLAYRRGAMPELIQNGDAGCLCETEEQMIEAVASIDHIDRKRCRQWVGENFSVERMVRGYEEVYQQLTGRLAETM